MEYFKVVNWENYQHYRTRNPAWIKLHANILDDYKFGMLNDAERYQIVAIWLLASKNNNTLPIDPEWVQSRIGSSQVVDLQRFFDLKLLAPCKRNASATLARRYNREEKRREEKRRTPPIPPLAGGNDIADKHFELFWKAYPKTDPPSRSVKKLTLKMWHTRVREGVDPDSMILAARNYASAQGHEPRFVKGAQVFIGANAHFEFWVKPPDSLKPKATPKIDANLKATEDWLNDERRVCNPDEHPRCGDGGTDRPAHPAGVLGSPEKSGR